MATTTSTTATTSSTASIVKTLGSGSGIDLAALVDGLVAAQFAAKNAQLTQRADALTTQIGGVAKLKSGITGFDAALKSLVKGGTLSTQPTSSSAAIGVSALTGQSVAGLSARVQVTQLAAAQAATTNTPVSRTAAFRPGALTVTVGGTATPLTIAAADATLDGVAARINAAGLGLTAAIVTDGGGARLTVKGQSGAAGAFTIAGVDDDPNAAGMSLADLSVGAGATGTTIGSQAQDAQLTVDGATFRRATNSVADLLPGVRLDLKEVGSATLGASAPTAALGQAVADYVETFNQLHTVLKEQLDPIAGALRGDPAAAALNRALGRLTTTPLAANTGGAPRTLADLGVRTNRDGTLTVDSARLTKTLAAYPAAVEAMFADGAGDANGGLSAALSAIATRATDRTNGFDAETTRYTARQTELTDAQAKAADAATAMKDRLTQRFASMDSKVAAYKSTGDFLKQQVDAWVQELMYASALLRDPARTYREIDMAGRTATADGPALVQLLYEELVAALRAAGHAAERGQYAVRGERVTRATAILFALEAGLDFGAGKELSTTLARLYAGARATVLSAAIGDDPRPFRDTADTLEDIAGAWATARAA